MPAQPKPYRRPGKNGYYCRLIVPKDDGKGYKAIVLSLGTSDPREARSEVGAFYWKVLAPDIVNPGREDRFSIQM